MTSKAADPQPTPAAVHAAIASVVSELPAIGKDSQMKGGASYRYRGIEAIKAELKPLLGKHGVHYAPEVFGQADFGTETTTFKNGNTSTWQRVRLNVGFRIYGPDGSSIPAVGYGEGYDNSDKALNKAMTMAEKQMLIQVFCVADGDPDPDHERPERGGEPPVRPETAPINGVKKALADAIGKDEAALWWREFGPTGSDPIPTADADQIIDEGKAWAHNPVTDPPPADETVAS